MERTTGTVKWFSQEKGFGFIQREDGPDVFVHHTCIQGRGFRTLEQGERVEFGILEEPKGLKAQEVVRLDAPADGDAQPSGGWGRESAGQGGGWGSPRDDNWGNRADSGDGGRSANRGRGGWGSPRDDDWGNRADGGRGGRGW